ncbi:D-TA family PLP-dependent enzyme [Zeaxanthinibacter enoshimensis]|uniref:D-serine deaminase-like pyridoxal phosphate-dependent protein n=1 Tax=Zeaxanthinibacter enoshimensis TaxID=392009 RepID=A0A4R6TPZ7_9FLAO|nr:D-TA family PLP-dependent enzyme [Zeaxanthinibacter enoshimensis]TDQ33230.1 D-serine deaminase-like pyridoxal phosphate-dependent protein [Zeaxanthinibacter enoshimensis]
MASFPWYQLHEAGNCYSPSLLVYPDRIAHNIKVMCDMIGDTARLRPHIKTHKTAEIIRMQQEAGIEKFKCATLSEAELLGRCKAKDVLLAMQPAGPNIDRYLQLCWRYPGTTFSTLLDNERSAKELADAAVQEEQEVNIYLDLNVGMNRTGIEPGPKAEKLYHFINELEGLAAKGLHVYDGHLRSKDPKARQVSCDEAFEPVERLRDVLIKAGIKPVKIIAGGSPTFPVHCNRKDVECSPGTTLLWDERYGSSFPELNFLPAAVLLTRVISKPAEKLYCLDLGHKSIAPEMTFPRAKLLGYEKIEQLAQSEEHLVIRSEENEKLEVGDEIYAIPMHICPTVAKYPKLQVVEKGEIVAEWRVAARDHVWQEKIRFKGRHRS